MSRVALITCQVLPEPDHDQGLMLDALRDAGLHTEMLAWDDPSADPGQFDLCVLRSCWNYIEHLDAFLQWITHAAAVSKLLNPLDVVRTNVHKRYLLDLERHGIPVFPTVFFDRGQNVDLGATLDERGWEDFVVKPAVSAGSFRTRRFSRSELAAGQEFLAGLLADRDAMVQKFMPEVEASGERAVVMIDGELTHAVIKTPRFDGHDESVSDAIEPTDADRAIAKAALAGIDVPLLYGRVDVVPDADGQLRLSELELTEPSLFFLQHRPALDRFVRAVRRETRSTGQ